MTDYLLYRGRWLALAVLVAAAATTLGGIDGATPAEQLGAATGTVVRSADVAWVDPAPDEDGPLDAFALRRVVFAGVERAQGGGPRDVYTAVARVLPNGVVAAVYAVRNVTRSAAADEGELVVGPGGFVAFAVRVGGEPVGVGVLGFPAERPRSREEDGSVARVRAAMRDWVRDGRPQGLTLHRLLVPTDPPEPLVFGFDGGELVVSSGPVRLAALEPSTGRLDCPRGGCVVEERVRGLLPPGPWAADLLRGGGVGAELVARLEDLALTLRERWAAWSAALGGATPAWDAVREVSRSTQPAVAVAASPAEEELEPVAWPPPPLAPVVSPPLSGEGEWRAFADSIVRGGPRGPALLTTFLRPDPARAELSQVLITVWDPSVVDLGFVPGTLDPPAADGTLPAGRVPREPELLGRLLAGLSGGFQAVNGQFGQVVDRRVFVPLQPWAATIARFDDGALGFGTWPLGLPDLPRGIASARQNLSPLVEDGEVNPYGRKAWGGLAPVVPTDGRDEDLVPTVRSALCMTSDGLAAHLWGSYLTVRGLGAAALAARCTYAVALDINPGNAIVELYRVGTPEELAALGPLGEGEASGELAPTGLRYRAHLLLSEMADDPGRFLEASERDLLFLALRPEPLPSRAPPEAERWDDGTAERPVHAGERLALRRLFPDVEPVPPTTWWPAQRDSLPRDYVRRIKLLWERKGGGARGF